MEKFFNINELYEIYGNLLTQTQRDVVDLYYKMDYSITEIAQQLNISKQAVSLNLKRAESKLMNFEKELEIFKNIGIREKNLSDLNILFKKLKGNSKDLDLETFLQIKKIIFDNGEV